MTKFISDEALESWFRWHPPTTKSVEKAHDRVRREFCQLALMLNHLLPESPDKTVALRSVRTAMYDANACIAVNQYVPGYAGA